MLKDINLKAIKGSRSPKKELATLGLGVKKKSAESGHMELVWNRTVRMLEIVMGSVLSGLFAILLACYKVMSSRIGVLEKKMFGNLSKNEVRELIEDKQAPIYVTLNDIKKDLEILSSQTGLLRDSHAQIHSLLVDINRKLHGR